MKVEATVANLGFLPTYISQMALNIHRDHPIIVTVETEGCELVSEKKRIIAGHLAGNAPKSPGYFLFSGGSDELPSKQFEWIFKKTRSVRSSITITCQCAKGGRDTKTIFLE